MTPRGWLTVIAVLAALLVAAWLLPAWRSARPDCLKGSILTRTTDCRVVE